MAPAGLTNRNIPRSSDNLYALSRAVACFTCVALSIKHGQPPPFPCAARSGLFSGIRGGGPEYNPEDAAPSGVILAYIEWQGHAGKLAKALDYKVFSDSELH